MEVSTAGQFCAWVSLNQQIYVIITMLKTLLLWIAASLVKLCATCDRLGRVQGASSVLAMAGMNQ